MMNNENKILDLRAMGKDAKTPARESAPGHIAWETEEFPYHEKDFRWFLVAGIVIAGIIISLIILKNIFGAATFLLFTVIGYLYATKKPNMLSVSIDARGISVNGTLTGYSHIASFWVLYEPPVKDLIIIQKEKFTPKTIIPLGDANPVEVRAILLANSVTEKEEEESIAEILSRRFRF